MKNIEKQVDARLNRYEEVGMAQLPTKRTHVPCWIQIRPQPDAKHKIPSIKISKISFVQGETLGVLVVSISDTPTVIAGNANFPKDTMYKVYSWVRLNKNLLLKYWNKEIEDTIEVGNGLKPIP